MKKWLCASIIILVGVVIIMVFMVSRDGVYTGKAEFLYDEIIKINTENEETFEYVNSVLLQYEEAFYVQISRRDKSLLFLHGNRRDEVDIGYVKDELFETYLRRLLINNKLGELYVFNLSKTTSRVIYGPNQPIQYREQPVAEDKLSSLYGLIKEHWYYYVHVPI